MSAYKVIVTRSAEKELASLPVDVILRIREAIQLLATNPRPSGCKKLTGKKDLYRIHVDNYRIIYSIHDGILTVTVLAIGDRKNIYG
jgi:mRNA interferase RelE/StbE